MAKTAVLNSTQELAQMKGKRHNGLLFSVPKMEDVISEAQEVAFVND